VIAIYLVLWVRMFVLAATEEESGDKIVWSLAVFFGGPLGMLLYWLVRLPARSLEERRGDREMLRQMREEFERDSAFAANKR